MDCGVRGMCSLAMGGPRTDQVLAGSSDASLFAMEVPPNAGGEAEPEKLGDYHLGRVTAAVPLSDTEHFATCGEDGTLRLWSSGTARCGLWCLCIPSSASTPNCLSAVLTRQRPPPPPPPPLPRMVAKRQFGSVQKCLASSENSACIAMGSESGIVRCTNVVAETFCG